MTRIATCVLVCAAALLTGCRFEGAVDVAVEADGSGTLAYAVTADRALLASAAESGVDPLARLEQAGAQLDDWEVGRSATADGGATVTLSTAFADAAELERISGDVAGALEAPELAPLGPLRLAVADDTVTLDGSAGLAVTREVRELGLTRAQAHARLAEAVGLRVEARMPGPILESNADARPDETTAVWDIAAGERRILQVAAERPWSLQRVLALVGGPYVAGAIALGVLVVLTVLVLWRRRRAAADGERTDGASADGASADGDGTGGERPARGRRPADAGDGDRGARRPARAAVGAADQPTANARAGEGGGERERPAHARTTARAAESSAGTAGDRDGEVRPSGGAGGETDDGWLPVVRAGPAGGQPDAGAAGADRDPAHEDARPHDDGDPDSGHGGHDDVTGGRGRPADGRGDDGASDDDRDRGPVPQGPDGGGTADDQAAAVRDVPVTAGDDVAVAAGDGGVDGGSTGPAARDGGPGGGGVDGGSGDGEAGDGEAGDGEAGDGEASTA